MQGRLIRHPQSLGGAALRIDVEATRGPAGEVSLAYLLAGDLKDVRLPPPEAPERRDGLWRTTCFEAFIRHGESEAYAEFNFSPSGAWAAYHFIGYRGGMQPLEISAPQVILRSGGGGLVLSAKVDMGALDGGEGPVRLGLSAVIESVSGAKSYWALAHPAGRPDFHHADCFAGELA